MVKSKDRFWEFATDLKGRFKCNFCSKEFSGGATRVKAHLIGIQGRDIALCDKVTEEVQAMAVLVVGPLKKSRVAMMVDAHPRIWWELHGGDLPILQRIAIIIHSQPCSSSTCERNWSAFETAQTKKRNKLSTEMLETLVYTRMNSLMMEKVSQVVLKDSNAINLDKLDELPENLNNTKKNVVPSDEDTHWLDALLGT